MIVRNLRLLFVIGLICTALAKDDNCECSTAELVAFGAGGAVATVVAAPLAIAWAGFTSAGVAAGSVASWLMSATAIANGGGVVTGGVVATLQSVGAAGIGVAGNAGLAATGASALAAACNKIKCG